MNQIFRNKVDSFTSWNKTNPLEFYTEIYNYEKHNYDYNPKEVLDLSIKELGLEQVIVNCLQHNLDYASGVNNNIETRAGALRSALDIWRHIKKYNPEITIYEVMKCIAYNGKEMNLYSHFCCTIERRVFRISDADEDDSYEDYYPDYPREINDYDENDEFGLYFFQWSEL